MKWWYLLLGLLLFAVVVVVNVPASFLVSQVQDELPQVQVLGAQGSAWEGSASSLVIEQQHLRDVEWDLQPLSLFTGGLSGDVKFGSSGYGGQGKLRLGLGNQFSAGPLSWDLPASIIEPYLPARGTKVSGQLSGNLDQLTVDDGTLVAAQGKLAWRGAQLAMPRAQFDLGDFQAQLANVADGVEAQITNPQGPLDLQAKVTLLPDRSYQVNGSVRDDLPQDLNNAFRFFARPDGQGRLQFQYQGRY